MPDDDSFPSLTIRHCPDRTCAVIDVDVDGVRTLAEGFASRDDARRWIEDFYLARSAMGQPP